MAHEPFDGWIDIYGRLDDVRAIAQEHLRNQAHLVREDAFCRNGYEVHRVYLTSHADLVRLGSLYYDAFNKCQFCGSFDVVWMQGLAFTEVYCHVCKVHRAYRPDAPAGRDAARPAEPYFYDLAPNVLHPCKERLPPEDAGSLLLVQMAGEFGGEPSEP